MCGVQAALAGYQHNNIFVAFSGGVDSTVLLHALAQTMPATQLRAIHIHHHLYPEADNWQQHCEQFCAQLNIPIITVHLDGKPGAGASIEAWAREQRYRAMQANIKPNEILMTAQHQGDQAETFLLQLMRGSGMKGLSAMPTTKPFANTELVRPFLGLPKSDLIAYAKAHDLTWVEDHSNQNAQFDRNFIRNEILPVLQTRWPSVEHVLARVAEHCGEQQALTSELLAPLLVAARGSRPETVSIQAVLKHAQSVQKALIREWLGQLNIPMPGHKKLNEVFVSVIPARADASPMVEWNGYCIRRYRDDLYALKVADIKESEGPRAFDKKHYQEHGIPPWERV